MPLHERAAARVLSGEAHRRSFGQQRAEGEEFGEAPVDRPVAAHVEALVEQLLQLRVNGEALGLVDERVADHVHGLTQTPVVSGDPFAGSTGSFGDDGRSARLGGVRLGEGDLQTVLEVALGLLVLLLGDVTAADEGFDVQAADRPLRLDEVRHQGLGERWVVPLVVPGRR